MMERFLKTVSIGVKKVMIVSQPRLRAVRVNAFTISTCDIYLRCVPGVETGRQFRGSISDGDGCRYPGSRSH